MRIAGPSFLALWILLGQQGARLGSLDVAEVSWRWLLAAAAVAFFTSPRSEHHGLGRRHAAVALCLAVSFTGLTLWRHQALEPPLGLEVEIEGAGPSEAHSLRLDRRRDVRRLTGRRRNVSLEATGVLDVPRDGRYAFELDCDDGCILRIGEQELRGSETVELDQGEHRLSLVYRQLGGPAHLRWGWDTPSFVELLPLEYFIRASGAPDRKADRISAHVSLILLAGWWVACFLYLARLARDRAHLARNRWLPVAAASLVVLYGCFLRAAAVQIHAGRGGSAALGPWVPGYPVFNELTAPDDPYRADVRSYLDRVEEFSVLGFYRPSFREPLYIALTAPFVRLAGGEIGILIQSAFFASASLVLFWLVARKLHGPWWALSALVPIALHEWIIAEAATGYRMSAYVFFLLATAAATFVWSRGPERPWLAGALAGSLCLIRLSALSIVLPLLVLKLWSLPPYERRRYGALAALVGAGLVAPFLASNAVAHGDPFYSISFHTEFWLRAEGLDASAGPVAWTRYFTEFGRGAELVRGTLLGLTTLPLVTFWNGLRHFPVVGVVTIAAGGIGLVLAGLRSHRFVPAVYLCHLIPFAYIQNFPSGQMPRFVMPSFFFLVLAAPWGLRSVLTLMKSRANVIS